MECKYCKNNCRKAGRQRNGLQRFYCTGCKKYQQANYQYHAYKTGVIDMIGLLVCEGVSMRGIARILRISVNSVLNKIRKISAVITKPHIPLYQETVEVDELRTYVKCKGNEFWIAYALNTATGKVIDFIVGKRSKRTLRMLVNTLLISGVKKIRTDNLNIYQSLIPETIHQHGSYCIIFHKG